MLTEDGRRAMMDLWRILLECDDLDEDREGPGTVTPIDLDAFLEAVADEWRRTQPAGASCGMVPA